MIESVTKNRQSVETISKMVKKAFPGIEMEGMEELKEGYFNVAYLVRLSDGRETILKIAPPKETPVMTFEKNIMYSEVDSMRMIQQKTNIPIANIQFYDNSRTLCASEYFFMEKLNGESLNSLGEKISQEQKDHINYMVGKYNAKLNQIAGVRFGYYGQPDRQKDNWFAFVTDMIKDVYNDADALNIDLKINRSRLLELLEADQIHFEEVTIPRYVHWDLWAGNVFIESGEITGLIDFERCFWGDELLEVGFRTHQYNENFYRGYGIEQLSESQKIRVLWYDIYYFLTVALECDYRQYGNWDAYNWATNKLIEIISVVDKRISG